MENCYSVSKGTQRNEKKNSLYCNNAYRLLERNQSQLLFKIMNLLLISSLKLKPRKIQGEQYPTDYHLVLLLLFF